MSKVDDFLTMLCADFDFSHGGMDGKRDKVVRLLKLADLEIVETKFGSHSEHDQYIIARARGAADAPYDQRTCGRYPWAAAARISYLEGVVAALRSPEQK